MRLRQINRSNKAWHFPQNRLSFWRIFTQNLYQKLAVFSATNPTLVKYLEYIVAIRIDAWTFAVLDLVYLHKEPTWQDDLIVASAF